jgi:hypothetical protein
VQIAIRRLRYAAGRLPNVSKRGTGLRFAPLTDLTGNGSISIP